ncbi:MAG: VCBS repeat-containing protein, partial [Bdellovibrionales bacterium]|nr:VCBS repeat-containing protein [Bdellovibrionales bacterium]
MAVVSLKTNIAAQRTQRLLGQSTRELGLSFERLSSGLRINRASDDAAGLAIASSLQVDRRVFSQGIRNANDAISLLNIADGAVQQLGTIVTRLQELATSSANGTLSLAQRRSLDKEGEALVKEFNRITNTVRFNDRNLIDGLFEELKVQLGYGDAGSIAFGLGQELARNIGDGTYELVDVYSTTDNPASILSGDFDGDGIIDIVTGSGAGNEFVIHTGNGDGTFGAFKKLGFGLVNQYSEAVDFNGDGALDIVTADPASGDIIVALNDGNAGFTANNYKPPSGVGSILIGDVNNDGQLDVLTGSSAGNSYDVMLGTASGGLTFSHLVKVGDAGNYGGQ